MISFFPRILNICFQRKNILCDFEINFYFEVYLPNYILGRLTKKNVKFLLLGPIKRQLRNVLIAVITWHVDYGQIHIFCVTYNYFQIVTAHKFVKF